MVCESRELLVGSMPNQRHVFSKTFEKAFLLSQLQGDGFPIQVWERKNRQGGDKGQCGLDIGCLPFSTLFSDKSVKPYLQQDHTSWFLWVLGKSEFKSKEPGIQEGTCLGVVPSMTSLSQSLGHTDVLGSSTQGHFLNTTPDI